ncbi:hypothetical protein [Anaerococcus porci]|uniref:hypothetical protein n=1 Tax=Anaerococcus porci TaxID=2652269 RepID=UPI002A763C08|nr:hypothetical protein [Anaerococcus porci]MDY3005635.1 hypothetical protein [Anaerococcus porci]
MKKKFTFILILIVIIFSSCSNDDYQNEKNQNIEKSLSNMDKEDAELLENIYKANPKQALYYKTYYEDGSLLSENMNVNWDDKNISYMKNYYNPNKPIEIVYLFKGNKALYINIIENKFYRGKISDDSDFVKGLSRKYPDISNLYDNLMDNNISSIKKEDDGIRIDLSDGTYRIYNSDFIMTKASTISEGAQNTIILDRKDSNLDKLYEDYENMISSMQEVESLEDIK